MPIVCALAFYAISEWSRIPPEKPWDLEDAWVRSPLQREFLPREGARVQPGDPLLKVAEISSDETAHSWLVTPEGMIGNAWYHRFDAGGNSAMNSASVEGLARLPDSLKGLLPSDFPTAVSGTLLIAFPSNGCWVVRRYRLGSVPKQANELATPLGFRSSFDGEAITAW
jgi:hypothetical protein